MTGDESETTKQPSWWKRLWEGTEAGTGGQVAQQESSSWQPTRRQILLISGGIATVLAISVLVGYRFGITLWDWVKLLIVPVAIAAVGAWFTWQQQAHQNRLTQEQRSLERELAEQRSTTDQKIEDQRRQDEALQAYLEYMSQVLAESEPPSDEGVRATVRARTLALLGGARVVGDTTSESLTKVAPQVGKSWIVGGLDPERKQALVRFLYEADLIKGPSPIINLQGALLYDIYLDAADFRDINLSGAFLRLADLSNTNLSRADLTGADLTGADLTNANLKETVLTGAKVSEEQLDKCAYLEGATMPDGQTLKSDKMPHRPTFEEWLKDKEGRGENR